MRTFDAHIKYQILLQHLLINSYRTFSICSGVIHLEKYKSVI